MCFDTRIELLKVVDIAAEDLDILQAVLPAGSTPEGKHRCTPLQPPHMHLHHTQASVHLHYNALACIPVITDMIFACLHHNESIFHCKHLDMTSTDAEKCMLNALMSPKAYTKYTEQYTLHNSDMEEKMGPSASGVVDAHRCNFGRPESLANMQWPPQIVELVLPMDICNVEVKP